MKAHKNLILSTNNTEKITATLDGEIMTNYQASSPVSPGSHIEATQDVNGDPILFSLSNQNQLFVICRDHTSGSGWQQINIGTNLTDKPVIQSFNTTQGKDGAIYIVIAASSDDQPDNSTVYISNPISNDIANAHWDAISWVARPSIVQIPYADPETLAQPKVSQFYMGNDQYSGNIIIAVARVNNQYQHYFVNPDATDTSWDWRSYVLPETADEIYDIAIGSCSKGFGSFALYKVGPNTALSFTSFPSSNGQTHNRQYTSIPNNAKCIEAIADNNNYGYAHLFVGGDSLVWYPSTEQSSDASFQTLANNTVVELDVRQDSSQISIWWIDPSENLYFSQGTQVSNPTDQNWSQALIIKEQITQIAAYNNQDRNTSTIFFVTGASDLGYMYQDAQSTLWYETDIPLEDVGAVQEFKCYTSQVRFCTEEGAPLNNIALQLSASEWTYTTVNGNLYALDDQNLVTVHTDQNGTISFINKISSIATPIFTIKSDAFEDEIVLNPAKKLTEGLASIQTGDDLKNAKKQNGDPLFDASKYSDQQLDYMASSFSQLSDMIAQMPENGAMRTSNDSTALKVVPSWGMTLEDKTFFLGKEVGEKLLPLMGLAKQSKTTIQLNAVDWVEGVFGDVMQAVETAVEDVVGFIVTVAEDVFEFLVKIGETLFKITIECIAQALEVVFWLLDTILGIDLLAIIEWLGFIFDWGDILNTHEVISNIANQTLNLFESEIGTIQKDIAKLFAHIKTDFFGMDSLPESLSDISVGGVMQQTNNQQSDSDKAAMDFASGSVGGGFSYYQLQYSGMTSGTALDASADEDPISVFINDIFIPAMKDAEALIKTIAEDLATILEGFANRTLTIGQAIQLLLSDTMKALLDIFEVVILGVLELSKSLIVSLQDLINKEIDIPFLTAFYDWATNSKMSLLDGMALLTSIPSTVYYKMVSGDAPFDENAYGLKQDDYQAVFDILKGQPNQASKKSRVATENGYSTAQIVYSEAGGAASLVAGACATILDTINALSEGEIKFTDQLEMVFDLVKTAGTFPVENDETLADLAYANWGIGTMDVVMDLILALTPHALEAEVNTAITGPYKILTAIVELIISSATLVICLEEDEGDALAWDIEAYVQVLADTVSSIAQGISKIDPDPATEAVEQAIAILAAADGLLMGFARNIYDIVEGERYIP